MKNSSLFICLSLAFFSSSSFAAYCDGSPTSYSPTIEDAMEAIPTLGGNYVPNAMENLLSINYVTDMFHELEKSGYRFCASAVALERNIYRYFRYLVAIEMLGPNGETKLTHLLFQNASVQALHGNRRMPWVGLDSDFVVHQSTQAVSEFQRQVTVSEQSLYQTVIKSGLGPKTELGKETIGYLPLGVREGARYYLVSWMYETGSADFFSATTYARGLLVRVEGGKSETSQSPSLFNTFVVPLDRNLRDVQPSTESEFKKRLERLSN